METTMWGLTRFYKVTGFGRCTPLPVFVKLLGNHLFKALLRVCNNRMRASELSRAVTEKDSAKCSEMMGSYSYSKLELLEDIPQLTPH